MLVSDGENTGIPSFLSREIASSQIDVSQAKICEDHHGSLCNDNHFSSSLGDHLRFVDVELGNLVEVRSMERTEKENLRYATLSYTWGAQKTVSMTISRNYDSLKKSGSLSLRPDAPFLLSPTIRDGTALAKSLGFRYVWIDALCIIQDSFQDWKSTAPLMHELYGNSSLNICGAAGDNANVGLLGTTYTPRQVLQPIAQMSGMRIRDSTWNTRAWIFQERILSPRALIVVEDRVYFLCRKVTWPEDVDLETTDSIWSLEMHESPLQAFKKIPVRQYSDYVKLYSERRVTMVRERLMAFDGIATSLSTALASSFLYGPPCAYFDWAMLWDRAEASDRIKDSGSVVLPSWSWCGWVRGSEWRLSMADKTLLDLHDCLENHTWIIWYYIDEAGALELAWKPNDRRVTLPITRWTGYDATSPNPYGRDPKKVSDNFGLDELRPTLPSTRPAPGLLCFWTSTAHFQLYRRSMSTASFETKLGEGLHRFGLLDCKGDWCGTIILGEEWFRSVGGLFEFAAIS
ncbi:hypothetical protein PG996_004264 [Apiospora saccharicola]|uniref:Heterokaryon incompatibility domain-containing protein n=1 Tax=Apiospora saccharicola TaxID=335842 RepID=A0ABR1W7D1_9PEZI